MPNFSAEISAHLKHQDYSLAVRRMLDLSLDTGDPDLLRSVIQWSTDFRKYEKKHPGEQPNEQFFTKAEELIKRLAGIESTASNEPSVLVEAEGISKTYSRGNFSLHPISLSIQSGNILGVVGENGNGKTTLLRCMAGQLALDEGRIDFKLLQHPDYYAIKNHIAFIPQRIPKWYGILKDNLHFSASIAGIKGEQNELMVDFMLERFNLREYASLNWDQISSGYRTRFEIARILLRKPRLVILDEPLANLDINAQQTILTDLRYMAKSVYHPMGVLLSSQQLHEVEKIADLVLLIKNGHCLYQTNNTSQVKSFALEIETTSSREQIISILGESNVQIQYNGGFYTITSTSLEVQDMISKLITHRIPVKYFRDITYSTKRYF